MLSIPPDSSVSAPAIFITIISHYYIITKNKDNSRIQYFDFRTKIKKLPEFLSVEEVVELTLFVEDEEWTGR